MSVRVMSLVWEDESLSATDKIVMLSLADHADDDGYCYPSISRLKRRTGLAERTVQNAIQRLKTDGKLHVNLNAGRGHANLYRVTPTPALYAPPQDMHPAVDAPLPPHMTTLTPAADAPKPSRTINEPSFSLEAHEDCPFDAFNEIATKSGWPVVQSKSKSRLKLAKSRMKECGGFENWVAAMQRASASSFLSGKATGSTPATFDWLNKAANFTKLMEGNYDDRDDRNSQTGRADKPRASGPHHSLMAGFAEVASRHR